MQWILYLLRIYLQWMLQPDLWRRLPGAKAPSTLRWFFAGLKPCANPKSSTKEKTEADPYGMTTKKQRQQTKTKSNGTSNSRGGSNATATAEATALATADAEASNGNNGSDGNRNSRKQWQWQRQS
jgi:hypothetical protein